VGKKVILFERFLFFNQSGSSSDFTRMYRTMYTEKFMADFMYYAVSSWDALSKESGEGQLIWKTGLLNFGDPNYGEGGPEGTLTGPIPNLDEKHMSYRLLKSGEEISAEFPFRNLPSEFEGVLAAENGCINVPLLLRTLYRLSAALGVKLVQNTQVAKVSTTLHNGVTVTVKDENNVITDYKVAKVAITNGAYVNQVLEPSFNFSLDINIWVMESSAYYSLNAGPCGSSFLTMIQTMTVVHQT
jgi:sarcosine oxidase/L-pipecolate oxidase